MSQPRGLISRPGGGQQPSNSHGQKRKRSFDNARDFNKMSTIFQSNTNVDGHNQSSPKGRVPLSSDLSLPRNKYQHQQSNGISSKSYTDRSPVRSGGKMEQEAITPKRRALLLSRTQLPIHSHATSIRLALNNTRDVLILVGETGSGKSTQVPQYLLGEPWCTGQVGITQPRRVAAVSLARRVAEEMGTTLGNSSPASKVGYSVRFDNNVAPATKVKFLTDGMLLQEMLRDPWLRAYSVIVVDEVHERGVNVDLLLGFLRRILCSQSKNPKKARKGAGRLKVVVMSATAETEKLYRFFDEGFREGVERTKELDDGVKDEKQPQAIIDKHADHNDTTEDTHDIDSESSWSGFSSPDEDRQADPDISTARRPQNGISAEALRNHTRNTERVIHEITTEVSSQRISTCYIEGRQHPVEIFYAPEPSNDFIEGALKTIFQIHYKEPLPGDILVFLTGQDTVEALENLVNEHAAAMGPEVPKILALPLFAALPQAAQSRIFNPTPPRTRKIILSTNIAETSITIPGIVHVIDCGLAKVKEYRSALSLDSLLVKPISKSSAIQRKGRAGRERPGKCWRLYTEEEYLKLEEKAAPEVLRCDVSSPILTMKARGVDDVLNFPLLDRPGRDGMRRALFSLLRLNALDENGKITEIGAKMARLPLPPMLSRVLIAAGSSKSHSGDRDEKEAGVVAFVVDIIAAWSVEGLFLPLSGDEVREEATVARRELLSRDGDHLTLLNTVRAYAREQSDRKAWCERRFVNHRAMRNVMDIRKQLRGQCIQQKLLSSVELERADEGDALLSVDAGSKVLKCFLLGFASNVARLMPDGSFRTVEGNQVVAIHPGSVMFGRKVEGIMYNELVYTSKCYARGVSAIQLGWWEEIVGGT